MSSTLSKIRIKKDEAYSWKNIKPIYKAVQQIKNIDIIDIKVVFDDTIYISTTQNIKSQDKEAIYEALRLLIPWRKGPFDIFGIELQAEWRSDIKYNILRPHFDIKNKIVADIGCNNGYYMFKMNQDRPKKLIGFDPSAVYKLQFDFLNHFIKTDIVFEMIGVEYLKLYNHKFDTIFMLGVLYHRPDPIGTLKQLKNALNPRGEIIIDTFMIDGSDDICLTPKQRYAKIPNIYFIPTVQALTNWLNRAGFVDIKVLHISQTSSHEQRATKWSFNHSLDDFLDKKNKNFTTEGYPAPKRVYIKAT